MIKFFSILILCISTSAHSSKLVTNFGTLHGFMLDKKEYNLKHFVNAIKTYNPDLILTETRKNLPGPIFGSIDGGIEQAIVYAVADEIGAEVKAVDWWDNKFILSALEESKKMENDPDFLKEFMPVLTERMAKVETQNLVELNNADQALVRQHYAINHKYGYFSLDTRNKHICKNVLIEITKTKKLKVMTIFGLDHKYYLDDCLSQVQEKVIHPKDWYKSDLKTISEITKEKIIRNMTESKALLVKRIDSHYYPTILEDHFSQKVPEFNNWIQTVIRDL